MSEEETLSEGSIYALLVKKENGGQSVTISSKKIRDYFPPAYTKTQIEEVIYSLLEQWKQEKEEETDADAGCVRFLVSKDAGKYHQRLFCL